MSPADHPLVALITLGEGCHNYHHSFPWDYRTSDLPFFTFNLATNIIEFLAWLGLAYDLKTVKQDLIRKRVARCGDGSHPIYGKEEDLMSSDQKRKDIPPADDEMLNHFKNSPEANDIFY
jgi:stearoyl-CoA desaturase (delta-9 desaturase)